MSTDEQDQLIGQRVRELREKQTERDCLRERLSDYAGQIKSVHLSMGLGLTDVKSLSAIPPLPDAQAFQETITRLITVTTRIDELHTFLQIKHH